MAKDEVVLQVAAATNQDMGKGVARLSKSAMETL